MERLKKIAAIIAAWKRVIIGQGVYQSASWLWDNPIWVFVQLKWKGTGVIAMIIGSFLINLGLLFYYRSKKVSWLGWDKGVEILKEKEDGISRNFFRIFLKAAVFFNILLYSDSISIVLVSLGILITLILFVVLLRGLKIRILGDIIAFCLLSIYEDPFITTAYLRHGYVDGLRRRDLVILTLSCILSISYWTVRNGLIVEAFRALIK